MKLLYIKKVKPVSFGVALAAGKAIGLWDLRKKTIISISTFY
jgi:hypothetical protein